MTRTLLVTVLLALLAAPMAVAQHGPPPGSTDPVDYAQDYAADQAAQAQADPAGYAASRDLAAEAEHAAWLACWTAYEAADHALDPACAQFFTAPITVTAQAQQASAEVTQVLNDTGASALLGESLDLVNDTAADPTSVLDQVPRALHAVIHFVKDLVKFVMDTIGLAILALAAGVIGAVKGLLDLSLLSVSGFGTAGNGLLDLGSALASALGLVGSAVATASSTVGHGVVDAVVALVEGVGRAASATANGLGAAVTGIGAVLAAIGRGVADGTQSAASGLGDGIHKVASEVGDAADAVRDTVADAVHKVGSLFDGKAKSPAIGRDLPETPKTGTDADGLLDRVLDRL